MTSDDDSASVVSDFHEAVNMTARELETWLATDESKEVGATSGGDRKTGSGGEEPSRTSPGAG